jgi:thymidylate synthase|tara:strand:+ start:280 stop:978 length:699 start_codon:yes stop_codon:yes gene_type:complete
MTVIEATSPGDAWVKVSKHLLENGVKVGNLTEELNVVTEITEFKSDNWFDGHFREIMGDDRIDFAKTVTFLQPEEKKSDNPFFEEEKGLDYKFIKDHYHQSYWGRMVSWRGEFNQIENVIKILSTGKAVKRCELIIFDPTKDARNPYSQPCMCMIDLKPRNGKLYLTSVLRSNRVSKSGYADYTALTEMGHFLAKQSGLELGKVTTLACSCHIGDMDNEKKKTIKLLEVLNR